MKKTALLLVVLAALTLPVSATKYTVTTVGLTYSPADLSVRVGDTVTISASTQHPLLQVSKTTWNANGGTALAGGFGPTTKNYTFTVTAADTIYYICTAHIDFGMKGKITVQKPSGIDESAITGPALEVFPNPVSTAGTISFTSTGTDPVSLRIFSINGQLEQDLTPELSFSNGGYRVTFDASRLAAGSYFILVQDGAKKETRRMEKIQ